MFLEAVLERRPEGHLRPALDPGPGAALVAALSWLTAIPGPAFQNMLIVDGFATFFRVLVIGVGILAVFSSTDYLRRENSRGGEFYALILFSIVGQSIMASANELIMIFIGLEISSIASYILAGYLRDDSRNNESALKYFLLGSFATAFLLYGVAWIYGITGSTNLMEIRRALLTGGAAAGAGGHGRGADVRRLRLQDFRRAVSVLGAGRLSGRARAGVRRSFRSGPKAAAFAVLLRVFMTAFGPIASSWMPLVWGVALATMTVGNFAAILQSNIKRLLAYSSIAHAGYVLVAVTAHSGDGSAAAMFYLAAYALHQYRRVRGGRVFFAQGRKVRRHGRFRRARPAPARHGRDADHLHA